MHVAPKPEMFPPRNVVLPPTPRAPPRMRFYNDTFYYVVLATTSASTASYSTTMAMPQNAAK